MARSRRIQRSVRVTVASILLLVATLVVLAAVIAGALVSEAAIAGVALGVLAGRILYVEITHSRRVYAAERAELARSFRDSLAGAHERHQQHAATLTRGITERDTTIRQLEGTLVLADRRADEAATSVLRESKRANEAQERLAAVLDEVLGTSGPEDVDAARASEGVFSDELVDLPTVVDLLGWEQRVTEPAQSDAARPGRKLA
jgi:hypothetical protein